MRLSIEGCVLKVNIEGCVLKVKRGAARPSIAHYLLTVEQRTALSQHRCRYHRQCRVRHFKWHRRRRRECKNHLIKDTRLSSIPTQRHGRLRLPHTRLPRLHTHPFLQRRHRVRRTHLRLHRSRPRRLLTRRLLERSLLPRMRRTHLRLHRSRLRRQSTR